MKKDNGLTPAGLEIIGALTEFSEALKAGDPLEERFRVTALSFDLEPRAYTGADVKRTRELLETSHRVFARFLCVSEKTVRCWENGGREPGTMARRFMDEINHSPDYWRARLADSMVVAKSQPLSRP